jgi:hypothetical protein
MTTAGEQSFELKLSYTGPDLGHHYWLLVAGEPRAYAKIYEHSGPQGTVLELCDIETREGHRHRGYATELLAQLARGYGVEAVSHRGSYTADGFSYIAPKLQRIGKPAAGPIHRPMTFVENWECYGIRYC